MRKSRGLALGTALLVATIIATLGFALSGASLTHLHLSTRANNGAQARNLAQSAVAQAIDSLYKDEDFGKSRSEAPLRITLQGPIDGSVGLLCFDKDEAERLTIPYSTNNLEGSSSEIGPDGQSVPVNKVHLVGIGRSGGVERRLDVILHVPPYPYAVSSEGPIHALRGARVAALDAPPVDPTLPLLLPNPRPADIASNGEGAQSIRLGDNTEVSGDVLSVGEIQLESPNVTVRGQIRPNQSPADLPSFDFDQYDPNNIGLHETLQDSQYSGQAIFEGMVRRSGDVTFQNGMQLNNGLMYIDGDVVIHDGFQGSGLLVATGSVTVNGGAQLVADSKLALLAGGDVVLNGSGPAGSYFQGAVFTNSGVRAEDLTVVGALIAAGRNNSVYLENARVITHPGVGERMEWEVAGQTTPASPVDTVSMPEIIPPGFSRGLTPSLQSNPDGTISLTLSVQGTRPHTIDFPGNVGGREMATAVERALIARVFSVSYTSHNRGAWIRALRAYPFDRYLTALTSSSQGEPGVGDSSPPSVIVVDPSEFLTLKDKVRVQLWKEF